MSDMSDMSDPVHHAQQNHLLAGLPAAVFAPLAPHLQRVAMPLSTSSSAAGCC